MHRALQVCIAHQQSALAILHQYLQDQRHLGPEPPSPGQTTRNRFKAACSTREPAPSSTSSRRRTLLQVARESKLTRLIGLTSELLYLEQNSLSQLQEPHFQLDCKLSAELRNLCNRMATRADCLQLDADLKAIERCLIDIVHQLTISLSSTSSESHPHAVDVLKRLSNKFLDV
ncbi:leukemia-associated protein 7 [Scyliorhinus torazame]|uniref:Uncharacterized protein n=1 Tax=Scyliorhinus torazame TaxID=75743 RepID=A0A401Q4Z2_SCYTO|nr:hypothetical protein [Scyliorhinus torazame]